MDQLTTPNSVISTLVRLLLIMALLAVSQSATAADDEEDDKIGFIIPAGTPLKNFYGAVRIGRADIDYPDSNQDGSVTGISSEDKDTNSGFYVGYQFNDNVAVQGGYSNLGESDFAGTSDGTGDSWAAGPVSANLDADAWELGVLGRWEVAPRWYAIGFMGLSWWESKETFVEGTVVTIEKDSDSDATFAIGLEFDHGLEDRIVYRFMGAHHEVDNTSYDVNTASAEIVYRFP